MQLSLLISSSTIVLGLESYGFSPSIPNLQSPSNSTIFNMHRLSRDIPIFKCPVHLNHYAALPSTERSPILSTTLLRPASEHNQRTKVNKIKDS